MSILSAALRGEATGSPTGWRGDVAATAKRDLRAGETLDLELAPGCSLTPRDAGTVLSRVETNSSEYRAEAGAGGTLAKPVARYESGASGLGGSTQTVSACSRSNALSRAS